MSIVFPLLYSMQYIFALLKSIYERQATATSRVFALSFIVAVVRTGPNKSEQGIQDDLWTRCRLVQAHHPHVTLVQTHKTTPLNIAATFKHLIFSILWIGTPNSCHSGANSDTRRQTTPLTIAATFKHLLCRYIQYKPYIKYI